MKYLLLLISLSFCACVNQPIPDSGYVVPESCGGRWICEANCDPDYPYLCEPWSVKNE
jgi:hypothetical protein